MYVIHSSLSDIQPDSDRLWRYMDLSKLVSLFLKQALFFPKVRHVLAMDAFEGSFPMANYVNRESIAAGTMAMIPPGPSDDFRKSLQELLENPQFLDHGADQAQEYHFINCWHCSEWESAAMWKLYLQGGEGIAIQSTVGRLKECFSSTTGGQYIARVRYADADQVVLPLGFHMPLILWKRPSYEHEKEVRAIIFHNRPEEIYEDVTPVGVYVPCDLETLIERVYIAPTAARWFSETVQGLLDKFGLKREVQQSNLTAAPASSLTVEPPIEIR